MIKSGDMFIAGRSGGVVGAVVPWRGAFAGVAPAHIFHAAGTHNLRVGGLVCTVAYMPSDADLAFFPILGACQPTLLAKPGLGEAEAEKLSAQHALPHFRHILVHCLCRAAFGQSSWDRYSGNPLDSGWPRSGTSALDQHAHMQGDCHLGRDDKAGN